MSGERQPVFRNCNVCGRELKWEAELAMGVCVVCASEEVEAKDWQAFDDSEDNDDDSK